VNPASTTARNVGNGATVAAHLSNHCGAHIPTGPRSPGTTDPRASPHEIPSHCSPSATARTATAAPRQLADGHLIPAERRNRFPSESWFGADADDAYEFLSGQFAGGLAEMPETTRWTALNSLRGTLVDHATSDGVVYDSAAWLITASRGGFHS